MSELFMGVKWQYQRHVVICCCNICAWQLHAANVMRVIVTNPDEETELKPVTNVWCVHCTMNMAFSCFGCAYCKLHSYKLGDKKNPTWCLTFYTAQMQIYTRVFKKQGRGFPGSAVLPPRDPTFKQEQAWSRPRTACGATQCVLKKILDNLVQS